MRHTVSGNAYTQKLRDLSSISSDAPTLSTSDCGDKNVITPTAVLINCCLHRIEAYGVDQLQADIGCFAGTHHLRSK